jgi:hypothetical protein
MQAKGYHARSSRGHPIRCATAFRLAAGVITSFSSRIVQHGVGQKAKNCSSTALLAIPGLIDIGEPARQASNRLYVSNIYIDR